MIRSTFVHLTGVGPVAENRLWQAGIRTWRDFLDADSLPCRVPSHARLREELQASEERLAAGDARWLGSKLGAADQWRLYGAFHGQAAYVDIETTGKPWPDGHITSIALYDGHAVRTYVHGDNLESFADDILHYKLLVTFNGRSFDGPFMERTFGFTLPLAHLDLRHVLRAVGYKGGLKIVEKLCGVDRGMLDGVDGYTAVLLWYRYLRLQLPETLETLLAYNVEDVLSLHPLAVFAYNAHAKALPVLQLEHMPMPQQGVNPCRASAEELRALHRGWD